MDLPLDKGREIPSAVYRALRHGIQCRSAAIDGGAHEDQDKESSAEGSGRFALMASDRAGAIDVGKRLIRVTPTGALTSLFIDAA
jgi:hypothetical protein